MTLILMAVLAWGSLSAQTLEKVLDDYIELKNYLIDGNQNGVTSSSKQLVISLESLKEVSSQKSIINEIILSSNNINKFSNIEQRRNEFGKQSEALWKLIKANDSFPKKVYYDYCPMKKMHWISEVKEIRNPFFGKQMLQCGNVKESIN